MIKNVSRTYSTYCAAELDNLLIGTLSGANGVPFWMILAVDIVLTVIVLCVGNYFGGYFQSYHELISRIAGVVFIIIGVKMFLLL
ncbi:MULTISPECIES: hypothetical protein [unclassified Methanobrevibacter]|uniref:hypothetical protein n=2 Tax=unclassified Methanobrevibacter TaxID=2638681 RepID=UPI0039B8EE54